jgi:heme exporter protein A
MESVQSASISLTLDHVTRRFGTRSVFSDVCANVQQGQTLIVTGPNGSGKSTLLKIIAGLLPPSSGEVGVLFCGRRLDPAQSRRMMGYVAPDLSLYAELSGVENLRFYAHLRGLTLSRAELAALLERVGLKGRGRDLVGNYSSGMRQRLKYAFALLHRPLILLLDEPTANLDAQGVSIVRQIVEEQRAAGMTILATNETHELEWGDSLVRLHRA